MISNHIKSSKNDIAKLQNDIEEAIFPLLRDYLGGVAIESSEFIEVYNKKLNGLKEAKHKEELLIVMQEACDIINRLDSYLLEAKHVLDNIFSSLSLKLNRSVL